MTSASRLSVLFVSPSHDMLSPYTGTGARLHNLAKHLAESNDVYTLQPSNFSRNVPSWLTDAYVFEQFPQEHATDLNPWFFRRILLLLRRHPFDVVHVAQPKGVIATRLALLLTGHDAALVFGSQVLKAGEDEMSEDLPTYKRLLAPHVIPRIEAWSARVADAVTTVSEDEREKFQREHRLSDAEISAVNTGTTVRDESTLTPPEEIRDRYGLTGDVVAVFHGNYAHPPNRDAVHAIRDHLAPALQDDGVEFLLVGKGMPDTAVPNVRSAGFVDDLFHALNVADLAVVPITFGGGTKTKIFDYMALGIPVVCTAKGAKGIDLVDGQHALIVDDVDESFVRAVRDLATDEPLRRTLSENIRRLGEAGYSWESSAETLREVYDRALTDEREFEPELTVGR